MAMSLITPCLAPLLAIASLISPVSEPASYRRYRMFELAILADVVVSGEIIEVGPKTFDFAVEEWIVGGKASGKLCVQRFKNWTCHYRWTEYAPGQRLLLFLRRDAQTPRVLGILGAGDEGEMPFVGDHVITHDAHGYRVRGYDVATYQAAGGSISGSMMPFRELASAIQGFRANYSWSKANDGWPIATVGPRGSMEEVEAFAQTSKLALHLHDEARSSTQWTGTREEAAASLQAGSLRRILASEHGYSGRSRLAPGREPDPFGSELQSNFGAATAFVGDIDGDGTLDLAVGAPRDSYLGHFHGAVWILMLERDGRVRASTEIREQLAGFSPSMNEFAALGTALTPLGDLNGDSIPDLAVGAPGWEGATESRGGVWVLFLKRDGSVAREVELGSLQPMSAVGVGPGSGIGESLAHLGDLDGDGALELAIGQDPDFDLARKSGRSVFIVSLERDATVRRVRRIHDRTDGFSSEYSWFGDALAGIGDVDGDGTRDLAIADTYDHDGGQVRGCVWVVFLAPDATVKSKQKISDWAGGFEGALVDWARFGASLAGPGDIDGDGIPDLLVGSSEAIWTLLLRRNGTVRDYRRAAIADKTSGPLDLHGSISYAGGSPDDPRPRLAVGGSLRGEGPKEGDGTQLNRMAPADAVVWWLTVQKNGRLAAW
jgi:hypothetical protein